MLGSLSEADDAVQEAWLRSAAQTPAGSTIWALADHRGRPDLPQRAASRAARREEPIDPHLPDPIVSAADAVDPEDEALIADSVGLALLIVLDRSLLLNGWPSSCTTSSTCRSSRSPRSSTIRARGATARQPRPPPSQNHGHPRHDLAAARGTVHAFLLRPATATSRPPDLLDPDVILRTDTGATGPGAATLARRASGRLGRDRFNRLGYPARRALVNGAPGVVTFEQASPVRRGFTVARGKIIEMNILADPARLRQSELHRPRTLTNRASTRAAITKPDLRSTRPSPP